MATGSFCAEQLQTFSEVSSDLWFHDGVDILPVVTGPSGPVTEMRDRYYIRNDFSDPFGGV